VTDADRELVERAERIHREALVVDTHSDTTGRFLRDDWDFAARHADGHMDLPRMREGGIDAQFFAVCRAAEAAKGARDLLKQALDMVDATHETVRRHGDAMALATTAEEVRATVAEGKLAALIGIEGGHLIEEDLALLRTYHHLGARYLTLTHGFHTTWADSAGLGGPIEPKHGGLTDFGRDVVREMNRLGMMVDVSHTADSTLRDVLEVSSAPVMASHSGCRALADHPRNIPDELIRGIAERGGVVHVLFFPMFIDPGKVESFRGFWPRLAELEARHRGEPERLAREREALYQRMAEGRSPARFIVDHIEHVIELVGDDHVGLGADWDGVSFLPEGMEDCSKLPYVTLELLRRGHSETAIRKVLGENTLRMMAQVEVAAEDLQP
jgi:membrane dipeptidase